MKKKFLIVALIGLVLAGGIILVGCSDDGCSADGNCYTYGGGGAGTPLSLLCDSSSCNVLLNGGPVSPKTCNCN